MAQGWISLDRQVTDNWIWKDKPYAKGQAWIDILLRVNHKANKVPIGNKIIDVEPGQTIWSIDDMASSWGWSRKKVSNFLNILQSESQIDHKRTSKYTTVTVVNWASYQNKEHQKNIKGTSRAHQKNTNNNDNNENNDNKYKSVYDYYKDNCKTLPQAQKLTDARKKSISARIKDYGIDEVFKVLDMAEASKFLTKDSSKKWLKFDWIFNPNNFIKILEGDYVDKNSKPKSNIIQHIDNLEGEYKI